MSQTCHLRRLEFEGFDALPLSNGLLSLTVMPSLGEKISSTEPLPAQREWLRPKPHLAYPAPKYAAFSGERYDPGGLDAYFPAVNPGPARPKRRSYK